MIFVAIVSMLSLFIITLHSCNPLGSNTDSTYSLTGRMLKDCSGEPYANYSLTFYIPGDGMFTKKAVLGTVSTDDKGYFKLSNIPSNKNSNINLQHITIWEIIMGNTLKILSSKFPLTPTVLVFWTHFISGLVQITISLFIQYQMRILIFILPMVLIIDPLPLKKNYLEFGE